MSKKLLRMTEDTKENAMKKASIIISVDNTFAIVSNFFEILFSHIHKDSYEIIVIDDCCSDIQAMTYINKLAQNRMIDVLIPLKSKNGFGKANNIGVQNSTTDCLIFMNSDIIINDDILEKLVEIYYQKEFAAFQPLLLYPQTQCIQSAGHIFATYFNKHSLENNTVDILFKQEPIIRQALTLAFCIIDKKSFYEAGGFDEFYYNGYEGIELILKISQRHKCVLIPYLHAYHVRSVAVKNTTFDEEQKIPYFWCRCSNIIKNDYVEFIKQYIPQDLYNNYYIGIQLTSLDLLSEVKKAGMRITESLLLIQRGQIEFFSLLPHAFINSLTPLLFLCDNYTQLAKNKLWICMRNNKNDLVIDSNGNVKHIIDLVK